MPITRQLGYTVIQVNAIGLGAMPLSLEGRPDEKTAFNVIKTFVENGGNFIDSANMYCIDDADVGHNERLINKALNQLNNTHDVIIATKGGLRRPQGGWTVDASPDWLRQSCEKSLQDLDVDRIFLYQLHAPDPDVPIIESVGELARLKEEGKIQHIGLSNVSAYQIKLALSIAPILSVQNKCHLFNTEAFTDGVIECCIQNNISFIAHSPVGGHFLHQEFNQNKQLKNIAQKYQASPYQIMIAWLLNKSPFILPIPGATKVSSVLDSLSASTIALEKEDIKILEKLNTDK